MTLRQHRPGCYRVTLAPFLAEGRFAQIVKGRFTSSHKWGDEFRENLNGRHWRVSIHNTETGGIVRFAGVHNTLRDALAEIAHELPPAPAQPK